MCALITHFASTTASTMPSTIAGAQASPDGLIRLAVGIEDFEDLVRRPRTSARNGEQVMNEVIRRARAAQPQEREL
ncbi:MAG: hypothetical protein U0165_16530 [Polyangiaceae bacterium]